MEERSCSTGMSRIFSLEHVCSLSQLSPCSSVSFSHASLSHLIATVTLRSSSNENINKTAPSYGCFRVYSLQLACTCVVCVCLSARVDSERLPGSLCCFLSKILVLESESRYELFSDTAIYIYSNRIHSRKRMRVGNSHRHSCERSWSRRACGTQRNEREFDFVF